MNNCLCNIFDNQCIWIIIIALLIIFCCCGNQGGCGGFNGCRDCGC